MDKPGYTPGPWFLINDHCVGGPIEPGWEEAGCGVAHCGMRARTDEEATANARLIAAAPDLVEALRALVADREEVAKYSWKTWMGGEWHWNDDIWERNDPDEFKLIKAARAALSKALGEGQEDNG